MHSGRTGTALDVQCGALTDRISSVKVERNELNIVLHLSNVPLDTFASTVDHLISGTSFTKFCN